jgi:hypothetical protein
MKSRPCNCLVEVSPGEVDAGADITLKVRVEFPRQDGLRGSSVSIRNQEDAELARADLKKSGDGIYEANDIVVAAPCVVGEHVYRAIVVAADQGGALYEQASTEVRFAVKAHAAQLNVWDVPSAIVAGERFRVSAGVRCSAGCDLAGQRLSIFDQEGSRIGTVKLGHDVWPGTEALYFAEVEARAPLTAGSHQWEVKIAEWVSELPHATGSFSIAFRVVSAPDCEVTVRALDREKRTPIKGARVVMHPYRAVTDKNGVAKVRVARGQYDILVSGSRYMPASTSVEVTADIITSAELDADQPDEVIE